MSEKLDWLNNASPEAAKSSFLDCCGSQNWALKMTGARPFAGVSDLLEKAEKIWQSLDAQDWLEAFAAHPKIGAKKAAPAQQAQSAKWSSGEQSGTNAAAETILDALAEANRLYENKFGFIFIVCATGKSAEEMLELCRKRLSSEADAEIRIAAGEQGKITEIRLKKLLES
ncbi:MAG: 2-oxo-4-hydroxy-4-carboxy-5-ureidoimidazoline decarboxylase [Pyrinomonadaceae bacterium]